MFMSSIENKLMIDYQRGEGVGSKGVGLTDKQQEFTV